MSTEGTRFRLYHAANATLDARPGRPVAGFDRRLDALQHDAPLPAPLATRFAFVGAGATLAVAADDAELAALHRGQVLLVHEDARGDVLDATALQVAGAFDDCLLYTSPSPRDRTRSRMPSSA